MLRFWRLGAWGFEGDEIFTYRDSLHPRFTNPRPLLYLLNHYLIAPLHPLDELTMRILPAIFGVLAIPALYLIGRRLVGTRAALFGAVLLTLNPMHVYQSQYARYWSLVFLLCAVYPYAIYWGIRDKDTRWMVLGLITGVLAVLAHPVAILPLGGLALAGLFHIRREALPRLWAQPKIRWLIIIGGIIVLIAAVRSFSFLQGWIDAHDEKARVPDRLFSRRAAFVKQAAILAAFVDDVTLPVALLGALGIYLLWRTRDRSAGVLLTCVFLVPVLAILLISFRTPVSPNYLIVSAPLVFLGAGVILDGISRAEFGLRPRWLIPVTLAFLAVAPGLPTLISQYRDGTRYDLRGAARWIATHQTPGDAVYSDQFRVVTHYLPGTRVEHLAADTVALGQVVRALPDSGKRQALWIVAPAPSHPFRTSMTIKGLIYWVYDNCQLRTTVGVGRLDLRQNYLQVYRCPPPSKAGLAEGSARLPSAGERPLRSRTSR
jgi:hypothetical protein